MAILEAIGVVLYGIGKFFGKAYEVTRDLLYNFFQVMPKPLRFFIFLFMLLSLSSLIVPKFIGISYTCDTEGNSYNINYLKAIVNTEMVDNLAVICGGNDTQSPTSSKDISFSSVMGSMKDIFVSVFSVPKWWNFYTAYQLSSNNITQSEICTDYRNNVLYGDTPSRDFVLQEFGTKIAQVDYENVVHIGCTQDSNGEYYQTLLFYNLNIFDFKLWLLIGVMSIVSTFAYKWYMVVLKR